ncbi:aspartate aminotransferase family protein [Oscillatoria acuminata]|uniref:Glutamate-1-semialdehyde aminotransferase n=1 Tax=Oscillatoria acuminata PCC 6304 TaxID=56110 RepID=K9TLC8_9CYAN|nr:aspartate aminotransferase family protein [Oscillatoria acuminata]AFY82804.1 glutamate-1-semialdehyde aminotransferase [Oscillatoria acuminata PCC 6304]
MNEQQQYLKTFAQNYIQRTHTSKKMAQTYRPVLADIRAGGQFPMPFKEIFYPIVAKRSQGCRIWDVDDNEYVDLTMGFGVNLFGHNPPFIQSAIQEQLAKGIQLGPQSEEVGIVAEMIAEMTQTERVAFSNTGTEAVMTAIRLARSQTGRPKIALFSGSYHGHFDGTLAIASPDSPPHVAPFSPGILSNFIADVLVLEYDHPDSLEIIKNYAHELAAVLVEPVQSRRPELQPKAFLQELRQVTQEAGIALIFDEMVTGFRIHPGGAQAWFGVQADIATYGKIVGGGMPIGIIAGKAEYLDRIDGGTWNYGDDSYPSVETTFFAGTFCKHPLAIAAAKAVLTHLKAEGSALQDRLNQRTSDFVSELNAYFIKDAVPIRMANFGSLFGPVSGGNTTNSGPSMAMQLLTYHLFYQGVMIRGGNGLLSTAHSDDDVQFIITAVKNSVAQLQKGGFLPASAVHPNELTATKS